MGEKEVMGGGGAAVLRMPAAAMIVVGCLRWKSKAATSSFLLAEPPSAAPAPGRMDLGSVQRFIEQTRKDLQFLNETVARAHGVDGSPIKDFDTTTLGEESSAGYFSTTSRIHIMHNEGARLPHSLIVKRAGGFNESFRSMAERAQVAEKEHKFYSLLLPRLSTEVASSLPRVYHSSPSSLLMEDLSPRADVADQEEGIDSAFAEKAVRLAAGLHAPFWGSPRMPDCVVPGADPSSWLSLIQAKSSEIYRAREFLGGCGDEADEAIGAYLHEHAGDIHRRATEEVPQTLIHADMRAGNLMRERGEGKGGCLLLDWQTFCAGPGLYDIASLLVCSMTVSARRLHCLDLLRLYQRRLGELGVDYAWDDLMLHFRLAILQQAFLINYAFEDVTAEDCPLLFTRARRRIIQAITDFNCLDLTFPKTEERKKN